MKTPSSNIKPIKIPSIQSPNFSNKKSKSPTSINSIN